MDETLMRRAALFPAAGLLAASLLCGAACASPALQDPTRPPAALSAARSSAPVAEAAPSLQSVQVGHAPGRSAVIDGESVRVGQSFRGARVMRIADNEVELQRGGERQVLRLYAAPDGGITRVKGQQ
jgi:MSHA biogenesis protein MshK